MKKLIYLMMILFMICGCTKQDRPLEEVKPIIEDINFMYWHSAKFDQIKIEKGSDAWLYNQEDDYLVYKHNDYKEYYNVETNKVVDRDNIEEESQEIALPIKSANKETLKELKLSNNEIKTYLKYRLEKEKENYNKLTDKEKLISWFPQDEKRINFLNEKQLKACLSNYERGTFLTYNRLLEDTFLTEDVFCNDAAAVIKRIKQVSSNASTKWEIKLCEYIKSDDGNCAFVYDFYLNNQDTQFDIYFLFEPETHKFNGCSLMGKKGSWIEGDDIVVMSTVLTMCVDTSLDSNQALVTVARAFNQPFKQNNITYYGTIGDEYQYNIIY